MMLSSPEGTVNLPEPAGPGKMLVASVTGLLKGIETCPANNGDDVAVRTLMS